MDRYNLLLMTPAVLVAIGLSIFIYRHGHEAGSMRGFFVLMLVVLFGMLWPVPFDYYHQTELFESLSHVVRNFAIVCFPPTLAGIPTMFRHKSKKDGSARSR